MIDNRYTYEQSPKPLFAANDKVEKPSNYSHVQGTPGVVFN
jgi:hypothetical protein